VLGEREEALEPQQPVQRLQREPDHGLAATAQLALQDVQLGRERADVIRVPAQLPHRLRDERVRSAASGRST
jgi:hypothetical protein